MKKENLPQNPLKEIRLTGVDPGKIFFTSDTHWCHSNIVGWCNRPWPGVSEMNQGLIDLWNSVVPTDGMVWHLGDFCFAGSAEWKSILGELNGEVHLVMGNHDAKASAQMLSLFETVHPGLVNLRIGNHRLWASHFPLITWTGRMAGAWNLFGHIHTQREGQGEDQVMTDSKIIPGQQYDVGVDQNNYRPISFLEIIEIMKKSAPDKNG